ncbi:hypothetical protein D3C76_1360290 [compost metagenome]
MSPCGGNQQGPLGPGLALYFIQVGVGLAGREQPIGNERLDRCVPIEVGHRFEQMVHGDHLQPRGQAGLLGIGPRHHQHAPGLARRQRRGQYPAHRSYRAGQGQFTEAFHVVQRQRWHLHAGRQDPQGDGQVEASAVLWQVCRRQVQGDASCREVQPRIDDRAAHPVLAFLHSRLRQANHRQ